MISLRREMRGKKTNTHTTVLSICHITFCMRETSLSSFCTTDSVFTRFYPFSFLHLPTHVCLVKYYLRFFSCPCHYYLKRHSNSKRENLFDRINNFQWNRHEKYYLRLPPPLLLYLSGKQFFLYIGNVTITGAKIYWFNTERKERVRAELLPPAWESIMSKLSH